MPSRWPRMRHCGSGGEEQGAGSGEFDPRGVIRCWLQAGVRKRLKTSGSRGFCFRGFCTRRCKVLVGTALRMLATAEIAFSGVKPLSMHRVRCESALFYSADWRTVRAKRGEFCPKRSTKLAGRVPICCAQFSPRVLRSWPPLLKFLTGRAVRAGAREHPSSAWCGF
jgi:hypothetical protein